LIFEKAVLVHTKNFGLLWTFAAFLQREQRQSEVLPLILKGLKQMVNQLYLSLSLIEKNEIVE
jgi:hypothetical protein